MTEETDHKWRSIPRYNKHIPWGYKVSERDEDILDPIPEELELLEKAKEHLKNYSLRVVAEWLSAASGRYISHMGLKRRLESERKYKSQANGYYAAALGLQKTLEKLRKIEEETLGATKEPSRAREFPDFGIDARDYKPGTRKC